MEQKSVTIADLGDVGLESMAIRFTLEYFGFRVHYVPVGRPNDLLVVLDGSVLYDDTSWLIVCGHGRNGKLVLPELAADCYLPNEPQGLLGVEKLIDKIQLDGIGVILTGCTLGHPAMGKLFIDGGASCMIGSPEYVDGSAALNFVQRLFYKSSSTGSLEEAFHSLQVEDKREFRLYDNG